MSEPFSLTTIYSLLWQAFSSLPAPEIEFTQPGALRSCFAVTDSPPLSRLTGVCLAAGRCPAFGCSI